jgi:hypothetical protein
MTLIARTTCHSFSTKPVDLVDRMRNVPKAFPGTPYFSDLGFFGACSLPTYLWIMSTMGTDDTVTVSRDRRVIAAGKLSERQVDATRNARVPDRYADLDREIEDWKP